MLLKNRLLLLCALLLSLIVISACGFHLRGASEFPFKTIYVSGSEMTPFGVSLRRNLKGQENAKLVDSESDADVVLQIMSERPEKVILSLTVQGLVREYTLNSYLTFQVHDRQGKVILPPVTIVLHRVISNNENMTLSKASEETMLYKDMQTDLVQQVVRRLSVLNMD